MEARKPGKEGTNQEARKTNNVLSTSIFSPLVKQFRFPKTECLDQLQYFLDSCSEAEGELGAGHFAEDGLDFNLAELGIET